jgi:exonuclease V gamma subunit
MKHHLYTGSFAALEIRWMDTIAELQKGDSLSPVAVLVGSNLLASYLKQRIVAENRTAANLRFYTFLDLCWDRWRYSETFYPGAHRSAFPKWQAAAAFKTH